MKICSFYTSDISPHIFTVYSPDLIKGSAGNCPDELLHQGFAWRSGNVDFYTIYDGGMDVDVFLNENVQLSPDTIRAIQVPFSVGLQGVGFYCPAIFIDVLGSVPKERFGTESSYLSIPPGEYTLVFAQGFMPNWGEDGYFGEDESDITSMWGRLWFNLQANTEAKILVQDSRLDPMYPLNMEAEPISED